MRLYNTLTYNNIYKNSRDNGIMEKHKEDPRFQFFYQCVYEDKELFLPVLEYVHAKTLCLQSYTLSMGHCKALAKAFQFFEGFCNRVILDNCGIDDTKMAVIL